MPQALHFSRKLFRTAKGPIPEGAVERSETGGVCSRRAREQQLFPVWKTAIFPAFSYNMMSGAKVPDFDAHIGAGQIVYEC